MEYESGKIYMVLPDDLSFNKYRRVEAYTIALLTEIEQVLLGSLEGEYTGEEASQYIMEKVAEYAEKEEEAIAVCKAHWYYIEPILKLLGVPVAGVKKSSVYKLLVMDNELKTSGLIWLNHREEKVRGGEKEENLGLDGEPLTTGDYILDLEARLRMGLDKSFDPSLLDRYSPASLQDMASLVSRINEKIMSKYDQEDEEPIEQPTINENFDGRQLSESDRYNLSKSGIILPEN